MQAFGLSLIKGRLGSDQERREIQTSPERKTRPRPGLRARPEGPGRRTPPSRRSMACVPGPDLDRSESTRTRSCSCRRQRRPSRSGMRDALRRAAERREKGSRGRTSPRPLDLDRRGSVGEQTLVKAGLRPPPPAASALTRLRSPTSGAAREIEGSERSSSHSHAPCRAERKKRSAPIDKKAPIRARP
jgi:hypothetical protein